jgi:hypothetical protein
MAEYKISRLRYTWRNTWNTSTAYNRDDVVRYGGSTWVCVRQHTSTSFLDAQQYLANPGDTAPTPAWIKMTDGREFRGTWSDSILYNAGDLVVYGGVVYLAIEDHTSAAQFITNANKFAEFLTLTKWTEEWQPSTRYGVGDLVRYNGIVYKCIAEHTSSTTEFGLEVGDYDGLDDSTSETWEIYYEGVAYAGEWVTATRYRKNDLVKYGGSLLRVTQGHTSTASIDNASFVTEFPGNNFYDTWNENTFYAIGDVVRHGGYVYRANSNNNNTNPALSEYDQPTLDTTWSVITKAITLKGDYDITVSYKTGDLVRRGGYLYVCIVDTSISADGSSLDYLDSSNWEIVIPGDKWRGSWTTGNTYSIGDIVIFEGTAYRNNLEHDSSNQNYPGDNGSGFYYWDIVLLAGPNVALTNPGDLLTFDLERRLAGDGSTIGTTSVPIGSEDEVVTINSEESVSYSRFGQITKFVYVSTDTSAGASDIIDDGRGLDPNKPFRTVRAALEWIEEKGDDSVLHRVYMATGDYYEVCPMVIPKGTAVTGSELRSTTVHASLADSTLDNDVTYQKAATDRISDIIQQVLFQTPVAAAVNNDVPQNTNVQGLEFASTEPPTLAEDGVTELFLGRMLDEIPQFIQAKTDEIEAYYDYNLLGNGSNPTVTGSNTDSTDLSYTNAYKILEANEEFIAEDIARFVQNAYPNYAEFNLDLYRVMGRLYVRAFKKDLLRGGNYYTLRAAEYYKNRVQGSADADMFYVRDTTGARDFTVKGLSGTLNPPNVFELYRRPTGGSFFSLDPGWGTAHSDCWINNRSPYIQNVTTFGNNCIGQKIDGSLHDGGNKSIVSNDFTQVISDGIGAWALNNGRAELVSVFTYYAQIGMFAERGGVLRATNGNSSYGNFGAVADGNDPAETPQYAEVNTRTGQAVVESAFAGEVNDEILILEYTNSGENYSQANYTFTGAGINAEVVQQEYRDDAVFQSLVKTPAGDSGATVGGLGYFLDGNNAQVGNSTSLTLASNDDNEEEDILGLRLIITSGKGAGQYGYVTGYNTLTKVCTVSRETDNEPGWDHVIPGTPSQEQLFTDNTYRFEPRITFEDPGFDATLVNMAATGDWKNVIYSETLETYTAVTGTASESAQEILTEAQFDVTKRARKYEVSLVNAGSGYVVDQTITILGSQLGGVDGEHDCIITVTKTTEDSFDEIQGFTFVGTANSGRFVATASAGTAYSYSEDGDNWTVSNLPTAGDWTLGASSDTRFLLMKPNSTETAYSNDGKTWFQTALPLSGNWSGLTYGDGVFVAVARDADKFVYTTDNGLNWTNSNLPNFGDSTFNEWVDIAYGKGKFIAIANSNNIAAVGTYDSFADSWDWDIVIMDVIADSTTKDWRSIAYGNNRWVAVSGTGDVSYSFTGETWLPGTMPTQDGSTAHSWYQIRYGQGIFFAVGDTEGRVIGADATPPGGESNYAATSPDGVNWTARELSQNANWRGIGFGNPDITLGDSTTQSNSTGTWIAVATGLDHGCKVYTGKRAQGRVIVESGSVTTVRMWDPGSGYRTNPTVTITDPNSTADAFIEIRRGDAVLAQPEWKNRGTGYRTSSTQVEILGDGFADQIPVGQNVTISGIAIVPGPGAQFRFRGADNFYTVQAGDVDSIQIDGTFTATFRITPELEIGDFLEHTSQVEIRERYSQVRITGHDFLDVGTGNFTETNYPVIYGTGQFTYAPENEVAELNGGRVFYTSTDQNGNFRCGELFAVEQATGIVTISADFFDLGGLTELALGGVRLGGSGTVIREFSTDPLFTQDSNNVVPTQRAIASFLQNRLNVGGADLLTASFIAGTVKVGPGEINNVAGIEVKVPVQAVFHKGAEISGSMLAQTMFYDSFNE